MVVVHEYGACIERLSAVHVIVRGILLWTYFPHPLICPLAHGGH